MNHRASVTQFSPVNEDSQVILEVMFDVDQVSTDLDHTLARITPGAPDPQPVTGAHADSLYFAPGEQMCLKVTGNGRIGEGVAADDAFVSFQIVDCAIITRPRVVQLAAGLPTRYAAPSPFQQAGAAVYPMALDFAPTFIDMEPDGVRSVTQHWKRTLDVGLAPGLWDLSLVLTIRVMRGAGAVDQLRVYSFDPETEVGGNGTLKR